MRLGWRYAVAIWVLGLLLAAVPAAAQPVAVSSADPNFGEQESVGLQVRVKGKGFNQGARAEFLLDDDSTGGITVRSTAVLSSTELLATIDIAAGASLSFFDIRVINLNGRTGRGSDLFQVVAKCTTEPLDPKFQLVGTLNHEIAGTPAYGPNLGISASLAPATLTLPDLSVRTVLVAAVGTPYTTGRVEVFVLDGITGAVLDGQPLCGSCGVQAHVSVPIPTHPGEQAGSRHIAKGDVNADGIPDFAVADMTRGSASVFVGSQTADGRLEYTGLLVPRPTTVNFAYDIAMGDLDGVPGDEIAVGKLAGGNRKNVSSAAIYLYRVSGAAVTLYHTLVPVVSPALRNDDQYGQDLSIGDVTHDGRPDLVVGVPYREVGGVNDAGAIFVHVGTGTAPPYVLNTTPRVLSSNVPQSKGLFGIRVAAENADSSGLADVVGLSVGNSIGSGTPNGEVIQGPVSDGQQSNPNFTFEPRTGVETQWSHNQPEVGDIDGDGLQDLAMGLPGATPVTSPSCPNTGTAYVYLGQPGGGWTRLTIQGPSDGDGGTFGYGIATADGYPFIVVGNNQFSLGSESTPAGQAFVYRVK